MNYEVIKKQEKFLGEKYRNKTVMIAGATGLIGSRIAYYIMNLNKIYGTNIKLYLLYRDFEKCKQVYPQYSNSENTKFISFNDAKELNCKIDYIFHSAGISGGTKMHLKDPMEVFNTSYNTTKCLLDIAVENKCEGFMFVSTYEVYGNINSEELIKEDCSCNLDTMVLRNIYAECKRMCESMCTAYSSKYGIKVYCGRLTSTFGNGVNYNDPRFFAEFARCIIEHRDIVLKSTGMTVRSYMDSDDAATAFMYIACAGENNNVYNVTNMLNKISIKDMAEKMLKLSMSNNKLRFDIGEDVEKLGFRVESCTLMDASKLYSLGWEPVYSLDETLFKLIESMKSDVVNEI